MLAYLKQKKKQKIRKSHIMGRLNYFELKAERRRIGAVGVKTNQNEGV
jgi:hypothetical protein